jgi:uncharacterized protein (DUF2249 family)
MVADDDVMASQTTARLGPITSLSIQIEEHNMSDVSTNILDVRAIAPRDRHPLIFNTFDSLPEGTSFTLVNDHDPQPLYYQFLHVRENQFTWEYLEQGPEVWRVQIEKIKRSNQ